jgi:hypothetical protein
MNTPVNSKLAKLLKEKKFNEPCLSYWKDLNLEGHRFKDWNNETIGDSPMHKRNAGYYSAPTIAQVVMWLYKKYGIWIEVNLPLYDDFKFTIIECNTIAGKLLNKISDESYDSPTEAYETAIEYTLNNLI